MASWRLLSDSAQHGGPPHAADGHDEGGGAERHFALAHDARERRVGVAHVAVQLRVDLVLLPRELLDVLRPLEVGDGDAARVDVDVRQHGDAVVDQGLVGLRRGGGIRRLEDQPRADVLDVGLGDDAAERGGHQHVDGQEQQILVRSEERRVGKEWRSWWAAVRSIKKRRQSMRSMAPAWGTDVDIDYVAVW